MADEHENPGNETEISGTRTAGPAFPIQVICGLLELTPRRLQQLVAEGWIERPERGMYSLRASVRGYIRYLRQLGQESKRGTEGARLSAAQATKVEMENWRRMGELQVTQQVDETQQGLVVMMKSAHESLPGRLSSELAAITEPSRIYKRLQEELRGVQAQCADYLAKRADTLEAMPAPGEDDDAGDPHDAGEVGGTESGDAT